MFQTTTRAGPATPGNACCIRIAASTVGTLRGRLSVTAASCNRMPNAGKATTMRTSAAVPPHSRGRRTTACATVDHRRDSTAAVRRRLSHGMRPPSTRRPSRASSAGSTVTEPIIARPTTSTAPTVSPRKLSSPVNSRPARHSITVRPETTTACPEVRAVISSARTMSRPPARSSRARRR
ncbi:UNVERIFIED_ORG: hypothetical protein FHR35_000372 [Microbispora rosea subsp. rosea]